jgi:hypothetical protein
MRSVRDIPGASVEHNKFCVSVHFRNVDTAHYDAVLTAVEAVLKHHQELHATRGRKVFEIRPQVLPLSMLPCLLISGARQVFCLAGAISQHVSLSA